MVADCWPTVTLAGDVSDGCLAIALSSNLPIAANDDLLQLGFTARHKHHLDAPLTIALGDFAKHGGGSGFGRSIGD